MKKNYFILTAVLGLLYLSLSSDIDGPAHHGHGNVTGATTGTTGHCQTGTCHGGNNTGNIVLLQVLDSSSFMPVTTYHSGQTYIVQLTGDATAITTSLPGYGFQASAVLADHTQAGTFSIPDSSAANLHTFPCGATTVVEHSTTLAPVTGGTNKYSVSFYWMAPAAFTDSVMFYALLNAVNGDGGDGGDYPNAAPIVTLHENPADNINQPMATALSFNVFPNPAAGNTTINYALTTQQNVCLALYDMSGRMVQMIQQESLQAPGDYHYILALPAAGAYIVRLTAGLEASSLRVVRL